MRRIIRIFLASSITEFATERMAIENFIRNISDKFEENYDVKIQPLLCENFDDAYSKIRKQEEYNEKIRKSDFCFFIFFTKAGEFTREEFGVARKKFEETGKPKIYTYFKVIHDEKVEQSLYDFMDELDKVFGHYYGTFEHIDTVKLRILLKLKLQEMDFLEIKVEGEDCVVDGRKALSLKNVSEFANNSIFKELKAELEVTEKRYYELKPKYEKGEHTKAEEREYIEVATKRQNLIDAIEELQKNIFNMSLRMCKDEERGEITLRQKEAYRLFEKGDLDGANSILDFDEMKNDYQRRKAIRKAEQKKEAQIFIREGRTKIDVLSVMHTLKSRFEEIEEIYDEITEVAFEEQVEYDIVIDFGNFLYKQNKYQKAYDVAKRVEDLISESGNDEENAMIYYLLGIICNGFPAKKSETEEYYKKAIEIRERLAEKNPERFELSLAASYNAIGIFYKEQGQYKKAEKFYKKAMAIYEKLSKMNPDMCNSYIANCYMCIGDLYDDQGKSDKAEEYLQKAIAIYKGLVELYPEEAGFFLSNCYNNAGIFYSDLGQPKKAERYYENAIAIKEKLVRINPERFSSGLAVSYNAVGIFYREQGKYEKAKDCYHKSVAIRENLAEINPEIFNSELAISYNSIGIFYSEQGEYLKAEEYFEKAIVIREELVSADPERYNPELAASYDNAGNFYSNQGSSEKAEAYYKKSIKIREKLAKENPQEYNPDLAKSYNNAGIFYEEQEQFGKAEKFYSKAIEIREKLAKENPERFNAVLADSYNNIGVFFYNQEQFDKAEEYWLKSLLLYEKLVKANPERFISDLSLSYNNIAVLYVIQGEWEKAENYFKKTVTIKEQLAKANPKKYNPDLARAYNNIAGFYDEKGDKNKSEKYYKKSIAIREELARINPKRFNAELAVSYFNFGDSKKDERYLKKALDIANTMRDNPYCRQIIEALEGK